MTPVFLSDSVWLHFGTASASTGAATNADSTPTVTIAKDGTDLGYSPTVTNVATGLYKVQIDATTGNGFAAGQRFSAYAVATVGSITGRDGIGEFEVLSVDLNTGVASVTGSVGSVTGLTASNLDATVSSRSTYAGGAVASVTAAVTVGTNNDKTGYALTAAYDAAKTAAQTGDAMALTSAAVDAIWDDAVDGAITGRQLMRGFASALMAKLSGAALNAPVFRDINDTKNRISATTDASGNRTAVTLDLT